MVGVNSLTLRHSSRIADLRARKGVAICDGVRVLVQPWLPILSGIIWQVREVEKSRLLHLILFLKIGGVHDGVA